MELKKKPVLVVNQASPHTIKKFELIENYVKAWMRILLNYQDCKGIVFIDCMCNSGIYNDIEGDTAYGTPIRVSHLIKKAMGYYPQKKAVLYLNDLSSEKIDVLESHLPANSYNFHIKTSAMDGNVLLKSFKNEFHLEYEGYHYLLVYDPYTAAIDWDALMPFLNNWGEVILNHMVSDSMRGISQAKKIGTINKYEETYRTSIEELLSFRNDRDAFDRKIKQIIYDLHTARTRKYFVSSFPFFNRTNALVYNLLHCSGHIKGFRLFKHTAWKTFGGMSSTKKTHELEHQLMFDSSGNITTKTDDQRYNINDIAKYLYEKFRGYEIVPFDTVWKALETHPIFPSDGFREEIKKSLRGIHGVRIYRNTMSFL